jgi:SAM-dependent MidA family methyltransferase
MRVEAEIRRRIGERGAITFAEFMELALFWPRGGYYLSGEPIGHAGDFYTSPQVHPVFGTLLTIQLFQMWELLDRPDPFTVVELGAGNGLLCRDIVACLDHLPDGFKGSLRYVCLDRRTTPGVETTLPDGRPMAMVSRIAASGIPFQRVVGCFLSNEYLDSFPAHQVTMCQEGLREVYVIQEGDELRTRLGEPSTPALAARLEALEIELTAGQTAEICLDLDTWAEELAASLEAGFVLTVDYGRQAAELYSAERRYRGTLTTYYLHTQLDAPLRHVGHQDITAQVDFTSVIDTGRRNGLESLGIVTQSRFLRHLGLSRMQQRLAGLNLPQYTAQANRSGMLDLARPGGLGDFKVLAQGKGVGRPDLWGFSPSIEAPEAPALADQVPVPLLTPQHLSLPEGRYPGIVRQWEEYPPLGG